MVIHIETNFPVLDLSEYQGYEEEDCQNLALELRDICHNIGFFLVKNHGIEREIVEQAFSYSRRFFELPLHQKRIIDKGKSPYFRGWEAEGAERTNNRPDIREQVDLWSEHQPIAVTEDQPFYLNLLGPNQWFPEDILPGFQVCISNYIDQMRQLGDRLMRLLALGLDLPAQYFDDHFGEQRMSLTKLIRYPETPVGEFGVNAHHDTGFLTILNPGDTPGLEIETADGSWVPVPIFEDTFVVNLGEMLQAMTGNYYIATPHRVSTTKQRLSIGYFHGPSLETSISRLPLSQYFVDSVLASPRHTNAGFMAPIKETQSGVGAMEGKLQASTYGDQLWNYFCRSYPDNVRKFYPHLVK